MQTLYRLLLIVAGIALMGNAVLAQAPQKDTPASTPKAKVIDVFGAGDLVKAAADFRKAVETFERLKGTLEAVTSKIAEATVNSSRNLAIMSRAFDPFGFKAAFVSIREQGRAIQTLQNKIETLQKAEIKRLKKESRRLKKTCRRLKKKPGRRNRGKTRRR